MAFTHATEKAYAAGIIDGEGSIVIDKSTAGRYCLRLVVTNTNENVLSWFRERWGGWTCTDTTTRGAGIRRRPCYQLTWSGNTARDILAETAPYMVIKPEQAFKAIEFQENMNEWRGYAGPHRKLPLEVMEVRDSMRNSMQLLNRGVAA